VRAEPAWDLAVDGLEVRRVARAGLLLGASDIRRPEHFLIVRDTDNGSFVMVPCTRAGWWADAVALSRDGRRMAYFLRPLTVRGGTYLIVRTLADSSETRFAEGDDGGDLCAAFSPDGRSLAVLAATEVWATEGHIEENLLIVEILDPGTGDRRRLWSGPGRAPAERAISWSPDGRFIEVLHEDLEERFAVTVLDADDGSLVSRFVEREVLGCPQGAWLGDHELVMFPEDFDNESPAPPTLLVDVVTGVTGRPDTGDLPHGCRGIAGSADLDGGNPRLLLTHDPMTQVHVVDIAPDAAPLP
jgi:hypothetical protein